MTQNFNLSIMSDDNGVKVCPPKRTDVTVPCCGAPLPSEDSQEDIGDIARQLEYRVADNPPIHLSFIYGLQQVLLSISSTISIPIIVSRYICVGDMELVTAEIMSTFLFMVGVCTFLQCTIGVRLPLIQGGCHKFLPAIAALMSIPIWKCPEIQASSSGNLTVTNSSSNVTSSPVYNPTEVWQSRMREIQGGIMLASLTQILIGATGLLGWLLKFIGPMTIVPTITLVGLSLIDVSIVFCETHWGIAAMTLFLVILFSLYLGNITIPLKVYQRKKGCVSIRYPAFKLLPVILAVLVAWLVCGILTIAGAFSDNPEALEYQARTDANVKVLHNANWFFFPYPGQWGLPTVSAASYMGMMAATLTSIIESVGDYYACARISGEPPPPAHAVNRGIAIEGFGSLISGAVGSGGATTSYSQNVGAIGFTKIASRRAFQAAGIIFILCGIFGKFGALLTMMPKPVLGGIVVISFGMVTSVGLSSLQFVNLSSGRNLCIIGLSLLLGLMIPNYLNKRKGVINTGNKEADQVILVLLSTSMFVGGVVGFLLDNTVPGSREERGMLKWKRQVSSDTADDKRRRLRVYELPYVTDFLYRHKVFNYIPFLPSFRAHSHIKAISKDRK
ncbi:solute carrier family 23 member 1-like isoform X2 [Saccostrea echinata]|uniref:solute carrier family 23 member 1-like isoform X2 n=1 Tax=Saccostrea echinata TaxID=191078 RepID=UPI002A8086FB|nr:solute carrier family 23 member 1-like isoform X2 [Saccostrea echinata]